MFERIHQKLGTAGFVISIIALIAALGGGAYAATSNNNSGQATASAKQGKQGKPGKPGKTGPAGPAGPAGVQGPAGAAGAKGDTGAAGSNGTNGTNGAPGTSVTNTAVPTTSATCNHQGGAEFKVGAGAATTACNGVTGFTATLPAGKTETGAFALEAANPAISETESPSTSISFPIPLAKPLSGPEVHLIAPNGEELLKGGGASHEEVPPTECGSAMETPGGPEINAANPQAAPGNLCVYIGGFGPGMEETAKTMGSQLIQDPSYECAAFGCVAEEIGLGASTAGARIYAYTGNPPERIAVYGTWAVTAPTS